MILRILRGRLREDELARALEAVRVDAVEWMALEDGLTSVEPAVREADGQLEFLLVSTWTDAESVIARGGDVVRPRGRLRSSGILRDPRAEHYELMIGLSSGPTRPGCVLRLSTVALVPNRSTAFYERVRALWDVLVVDAGLVALHVGRRVAAGGDEAVVISIWDDRGALDGATSGGFVGGEEMAAFYRTEPVIEHFTLAALEPRAVPAI